MHWAEFAFACTQRGIQAGVWVTNGGNIQATPSDADFLIAELEGPADYDGILNAIEIMPAWMHEIPKAVITNFAAPLGDITGYHPEKAKPLIDAGFECLTEAYLGNGDTLTPDRLDFTAKKLGWTYTIPTFGAYNKPLSEYEPWFDWDYGYAVYLAENVL